MSTIFSQGESFSLILLSVKQFIDFFWVEINFIRSHLHSWGRFLFLSRLAAKQQTLLLQMLSLSLTSLQPWTHGLQETCWGTVSLALKGGITSLFSRRFDLTLTMHQLREAKKQPSSFLFCTPPQKHITFVDLP